MEIALQDGHVVIKDGSVSCSCCDIEPPTLTASFLVKDAISECNNSCGIAQNAISLPPDTIEGTCPYVVTFEAFVENQKVEEIVNQECNPRYGTYRRLDDYRMVTSNSEPCTLIFPEKINEYEIKYASVATGVNQQTGQVQITCLPPVETILQGNGFYPGQSRSIRIDFENPIEDSCPVLYTDFSINFSSSETPQAYFYASRTKQQISALKILIKPDGDLLQELTGFDPSLYSVILTKRIIPYVLQNGTCNTFEKGSPEIITETTIANNDEFTIDPYNEYRSYGENGGGVVVEISGIWKPNVG